MVYDWDEMKSERSRFKRGFGFDIASLIFDGDTLNRVDARKAYGEVRVQTLGEVDGVVLFVTYTDRDFEVRWIISARKANRQERKLWLTR